MSREQGHSSGEKIKVDRGNSRNALGGSGVGGLFIGKSMFSQMTLPISGSPLTNVDRRERNNFAVKKKGVEEEGSWVGRATEANKKRLADLVVRSSKISLEKK